MLWYYMYPSTEGVTDLPFYVVSIGLHELQPRIERPNGYDYDQFFYNCTGSGWLEINNHKYELPEGSAFFIPATKPHCYYPDGDVWDIRWMVPGGNSLTPLYHKYNLENGGVFTLHDESELDRILNQIRMELIKHPKTGNVLAAGSVYPFIIEFIYQTMLYNSTEFNNTPYEQQMRTLQEYIKIHCVHPISISDLCKVLAVSPQHVCRILKKTLGIHPTEYINQVRIELACSMLLYSNLSIKEIGEKCGFQNTSYFCKKFKQFEHLTPLEYRNSVI